MTIVVDSFNSREFSSPNPVYQLSWTTSLIRNFLNFFIKKGSLDVSNYLLEFLLVFKTPWCSVIIERLTTFFCPPLFGILGYFWFLGIFCPSLVDDRSEIVDNSFQFIDGLNVEHIHTFEVWNNIINESGFLFAFQGQSKYILYL